MTANLEEKLPAEHWTLTARYGGVWSYAIHAPLSLDDVSRVTVYVEYGLERAEASQVYSFNLILS